MAAIFPPSKWKAISFICVDRKLFSQWVSRSRGTKSRPEEEPKSYHKTLKEIHTWFHDWIRILRYLSLSQNWIYFGYERNGSVYLWLRGKTVANCITCTVIHASLPDRGFAHSHLDSQCLPKCQVHLPAQGRCSYRILGHRTWVEMDTIPEFLQGVPCFHQLSYSLPLPWHWACPDRDASSAGTQKEKTGGTETANLQPACNLKAKCTFVVVSLWDLRVARQKAKLTLAAYYTQINEVNARSLGGTQSHADNAWSHMWALRPLNLHLSWGWA